MKKIDNEQGKKNKRSDVAAKHACLKYLEAKGFNARITGSPADITARKGGRTWYFEVKMTRQRSRYFGAATLTEWRQAISDSKHFRFLVAIANEDDSEFEIREYTPDAFMSFSSIPPFKIFFNIDFENNTTKLSKRKRKSIPLTQENFDRLDKCFSGLKSSSV